MKRHAITTLVALSSLVVLSACGGGASGGQYISAHSEGTPGGGTGGGGSGGVVASSGIYVNVVQQKQQVQTALHKFYDYNTPCTIPANASGNQDIECLLNVRELDLFAQGLKLEFNVPAGMCDYISDQPYWYWNRPVGYGPTQVTIMVDDSALGDPTKTYCTYKANTGGTQNGTLLGHLCLFPGGSATVEGAVSCDYDYSGNGGPNCCSGNYTLQTRYAPITGTPVVINNPGKSWGGSFGRCAAGPYIPTGSGWSTHSSGYPATQIRNGLNVTNTYYQIKAPIDLPSVDNAYAANFWDWTSYKAGLLSPAARPLPMTYSTDLLGNTISQKTNSAYTFACLDAAYEVKHRIRLYINEWDTSDQFVNYLNPATRATATPDATSTCDLTSTDCDDFPGWNYYKSFTPVPFPFHGF